MNKVTTFGKTGSNGPKIKDFEIKKLKIKDAFKKLTDSRSDKSVCKDTQAVSWKSEDITNRKRLEGFSWHPAQLLGQELNPQWQEAGEKVETEKREVSQQ